MVVTTSHYIINKKMKDGVCKINFFSITLERIVNYIGKHFYAHFYTYTLNCDAMAFLKSKTVHIVYPSVAGLL